MDFFPSSPTYTFRPKKNGSPHSKSTNDLPPILAKTLLDELTRLTKLPIWNETILLGEPVAPVLVAERFTVDEGQNQSELGETQSGRRVAEGGGKKSPFVPVSMKLL